MTVAVEDKTREADVYLPGELMPLSPYIARLRRAIGHDLLLLPGVAALVEHPDRPGRYLLHRRSDDGQWSLPAGTPEPGERPAEAVRREVREETGFEVEPQEVRAVLGGGRYRNTYPNGDQVEHVIVVFACRIVGGEADDSGDETEELRFFGADEILEMKPHLPREIFEPGCYFEG